MKVPLRSVTSVVGNVLSGAAVLARSGLAGPFVPRPALLGVLARAPFRTPNIGTAVDVHAALRPSAIALIDRDGEVSWRVLGQRSRRLANALLQVAQRAPVSERSEHRYGAHIRSPGDRVAFMLRNGRESVECFAGCALAGMAAVPINTWSTADDVRHLLQTQNPGVVIADREFAGVLADVDVPVWWVGDASGDDAYETVLEASSDTPPPVRGGDRIVIHTSGTTGKPKGAERALGGGAVGSLVSLLEKVPLRRSDVFLVAPPLFHQLGQGMMVVGLVLGTTLVLPARFDAEDFCQQAVRHRVTAAALLPVMVKRIADLPASVPTPDLRLAIVSGSALPKALRERAERRLGRILYDLYGSTEVGWATIATPQDQAAKPDSVGRSGRSSRILIVGDDGSVLNPGQVGIIHVASDLAFEGYTGVDDDRSVVEGALNMGDRGYLDEDGYLFVTGRADDMIVSGGENIYPSEVEGVLEEHPDIVENAVVGVDDEEFGQVLHAFVVVRDGAELSDGDVKDFVRQRLARYKAPKHVTFLDALPRNATGKVLKKDLNPSSPPLGPDR